MVEVTQKRFILKQIGSVQRSSGYEVVNISDGIAEIILKLDKVLTLDDFKTVFEGEIYKVANFAALAAVNDEDIFVVNAHIDFLSQVETTSKEIFFEAKSISSSLGKRFVEVKGMIDDITIFIGNFTILKLDGRSKLKI